MDNDNYSNFKNIIQIENAKKSQIEQQKKTSQIKDDDSKAADLALLKQSEAVQLFKKISSNGDARWSDVPLFRTDNTFRTDVYKAGPKIFDYTPAAILYSEYLIGSENYRAVPACYLLHHAHNHHSGDGNYEVHCYYVGVVMDDSRLYLIEPNGLKKVGNIGEDIAQALMSMYGSGPYRYIVIDHLHTKVDCLFCNTECTIETHITLKNHPDTFPLYDKNVINIRLPQHCCANAHPPFIIKCKHCGNAYMSYGTFKEWGIKPID